MPMTCRSSPVSAPDVSSFTTFWFSAVTTLASEGMNDGSDDVMCPTKVGDATGITCRNTSWSR